MPFVVHGTVHRFDSVVELLERCRSRFPGSSVGTVNEHGDFILRVRGRASFDSLIAHFEGSRRYLVMLPDVEPALG